VATGLLVTPAPPAVDQAAALAAPGGAPNVLVVAVDDMGWGDSPAHNPESRIPMPNLERLAASGMTFTRAYAMPKCAPTRYNLMTGNNVSRGRRQEGMVRDLREGRCGVGHDEVRARRGCRPRKREQGAGGADASHMLIYWSAP
jgi:hypothetical protein